MDAPRSQAKPAEAEWELVYERTRPSLVRALTAASGSYDGVEDAIQDAFGEALRRSPELANVKGWLFTVAIGRLRSHHRRARILRRLGLVAAARESDLDRALEYVERKLAAVIAGLSAIGVQPTTAGLIGTLEFSFRDANGYIISLSETKNEA